MWQCSSPIWCTSSVQSLMFHTSVFYKRISCIMYFAFCILFVFCMLYFVLCVFFVSFVFCTFGADPQCNASCSVPLCFTRRSPGENAELHPAREITASALDHSMMSRCQAYCWKGDICTVIFERYYGKYSPSAIILQCRSKNIRNALKDIDNWLTTHALLPILLFVWERCLQASGNGGRRE